MDMRNVVQWIRKIKQKEVYELPRAWVYLLGITVIVLISLYLLFSSMIGMGGVPVRINPAFATSGYIKHHYVGKPIDIKISDKDLAELKSLLVGFAWNDSGNACGHTMSVSITLTNGRKSITLCPACDGDESFRIGNSIKYLDLTTKQRKRFDAIVKKYGMTFPCV